MKDFLSIDIDATELVRGLGQMERLRGQARPIQGEDIGHPLAPNKVRALWSGGKGLSIGLPSVLLSSESTLADLLPRMLALPGAVTPVSSFMKAWQVDDVREGSVFDARPLSTAAALGFVGLTIGELHATIADADLRLMGMDGVRRTLSFVCAQAVMRGWQHGSLATILERWLEASTLTGNDVNAAALVPLTNVCGFLQALSDLGELEDISPQVLANQIQSWLELQNNLNQRDLLQCSLSSVVNALEGISSREKRFDLVMDALSQASPGEIGNPLERGFLISLIEPGSFEFLELAKRTEPTNGSVAIAYCALAAILGKEATLGKFNGFGGNILNQGFRFGIDMPMDVSIAELRILHNAQRSAPIQFRTRSPWLIDVELVPMVTGSFGNQARRKALSQRAEEGPDSTEREELLRENIVIAMRALEDANNVLLGKRLRQDSKIGKRR